MPDDSRFSRSESFPPTESICIDGSKLTDLILEHFDSVASFDRKVSEVCGISFETSQTATKRARGDKNRGGQVKREVAERIVAALCHNNRGVLYTVEDILDTNRAKSDARVKKQKKASRPSEPFMSFPSLAGCDFQDIPCDVAEAFDLRDPINTPPKRGRREIAQVSTKSHSSYKFANSTKNFVVVTACSIGLFAVWTIPKTTKVPRWTQSIPRPQIQQGMTPIPLASDDSLPSKPIEHAIPQQSDPLSENTSVKPSSSPNLGKQNTVEENLSEYDLPSASNDPFLGSHGDMVGKILGTIRPHTVSERRKSKEWYFLQCQYNGASTVTEIEPLLRMMYEELGHHEAARLGQTIDADQAFETGKLMTNDYDLMRSHLLKLQRINPNFLRYVIASSGEGDAARVGAVCAFPITAEAYASVLNHERDIFSYTEQDIALTGNHIVLNLLTENVFSTSSDIRVVDPKVLIASWFTMHVATLIEPSDDKRITFIAADVVPTTSERLRYIQFKPIHEYIGPAGIPITICHWEESFIPFFGTRFINMIYKIRADLNEISSSDEIVQLKNQTEIIERSAVIRE